MIKRKIVLFYPKPDKENSNMHLPLPVLSIASDLLNSGYSVEIIDERIKPDYQKWLSVALKDAILFGVSVMTGYQIKGGLEVSRFVKSIDKSIPVIWGGWHVSMLPQETLNSDYIDIGVIGPGEGVLQNICQRIENMADFSGVEGIVYKRDGKIIANNKHSDIGSMTSVSRKAVELLDLTQYIHPSDIGSRTIFWVTSKGCPFNCGFCCSSKVYDRKWVGLKAGRIIEDLEWLEKDYGVNGIIFVDTNFFVDKVRVVEMMEEMIKKKIHIDWAASVRVDQINYFDEKLLGLLKKTRCAKLLIGAESGSEEVLRLIDKNITIANIFNMLKIISSAEILAEIYIMVGFPIDPIKDLKESLQLVKEIKKRYPEHQFTSFLYTPYPGTRLYDLAKKKGLKEPSSLEEWISWNILEVRTPWIKARGYADYLHRFVKMHYPLAFPSSNLKRKFNNSMIGRVYWFLHKLECLRVRTNFYLFPIEWQIAKFVNKLRIKYKILSGLSGFR